MTKAAKNNDKSKDMSLSNQALGAIMMALQISLMRQEDIMPLLGEFKFRLSEDGLMIMNPPVLHAEPAYTDEDEEDLNIPATD